MNYVDLFIEHKDFVSDKWGHYFFIYQELLLKYLEKNKPVNILEIGVQNGGSLQIWEKFLPKGSQIYGVDINPKCKELKFSDNIHFYLGNASKKDFWENNLQDVTFDIILDDGSHLCKEVINTFKILFDKKLNMAGTYIIEDLHTSYWWRYQGGFRAKKSSIEYFKNFIDSLNVNYFKKPLLLNKKQYEELKYLHTLIKKISFYDAICSIEKYNQQLTEPFGRVVTGKNANVVPDVFINEFKVSNNIGKLEKLKEIFE